MGIRLAMAKDQPVVRPARPVGGVGRGALRRLGVVTMGLLSIGYRLYTRPQPVTEHTLKKRPVCPSSLTPLLDRRRDGEGGLLNQ